MFKLKQEFKNPANGSISFKYYDSGEKVSLTILYSESTLSAFSICFRNNSNNLEVCSWSPQKGLEYVEWLNDNFDLAHYRLIENYPPISFYKKLITNNSNEIPEIYQKELSVILDYFKRPTE